MFCRNSSLQAVCDTPIARITGCVSSLLHIIPKIIGPHFLSQLCVGKLPDVLDIFPPSLPLA